MGDGIQAGTVTSPVFISRSVLVGKSRRQEARDQLQAEGVALLHAERQKARQARLIRRIVSRQARAARIAYAAFSRHENGWEEHDNGGVFLAVDGNGNFHAPSWKDHTWYVPFSLSRPLHLVAWFRSAKTGKLVFIET